MIPSGESIEPADRLVPSDGTAVSANGLQPSELSSTLQGLSPRQQALLQDLLHRQDGTAVSTEVYPARFADDLRTLVEEGLVVPVSETEVFVLREVAFHPAGPGRRPDQLPGLLRSLPDDWLHRWQESYGVPTGFEGYLPLGEALLERGTPGPDFRNLIGNRLWLDPEDPPEGAVDSPGDLYEGDPEEAEGLKHWVLNGWLAPVTDSNQIVEYWLVTRSARSDGSPQVPRSWNREQEPAEDEWDQQAFTWSEQLKMLLVLSDSLPFRVTRQDFPNRLDLGEVKRLTEWSESHVQTMVNVLLERRLIRPGEERFFLTERAEQPDSMGFPLWIRPPLWRDELDESTAAHPADDFSFARHAASLLERLLDEEEPKSIDDELMEETGWETVWDLWAGQPPEMRPHPNHAPQLFRGLVETLVEAGWLDGGYAGERLVSVRVNDRTADVFGEPDESGKDDLPIILQPDGDLMVPLKAPLEWFRRINPFSLLVNVDHMIRYHLDRESLVQASNEGWDCRAFRSFLEEHTGDLPDPVGSLFKDLDRQAAEVDISEVHHLVEFDDEGTASKAYRALSNYEPRRVDGTILLLGKKTTEETIRRNLSRAGIRIQGTSEEDRIGSPVLSLD